MRKREGDTVSKSPDPPTLEQRVEGLEQTVKAQAAKIADLDERLKEEEA